MNLQPTYQAPILFFLKQMFNRYPSARSCMLEFEDDTVGGGFQNTPDNCCYRGELNDPQLANAGQTQAVFEFMHTYDYWLGVE